MVALEVKMLSCGSVEFGIKRWSSRNVDFRMTTYHCHYIVANVEFRMKTYMYSCRGVEFGMKMPRDVQV